MSGIGVYTMANDAILDWSLAFFESFRRYNPSTELIVIPFDDDTGAIRRLARKYSFDLFSDSDVLKQIDDVSAMLFPHQGRRNVFRKLACFHGVFDTFLYLDADIVILSKVEPLIRRAEANGADFVFFDRSPEWVYTDQTFASYMAREFGAQTFSAGAFIAKTDLVSLEELRALIPKNAWLKPKFPVGVYDQPYLNYVIDTKRCCVVAMNSIADEIVASTWAGAGRVSSIHSSPVIRHGKVVPFIHWAGFHCEATVPNFRVFLHFRLNAESSWRTRASCRCRLLLTGFSGLNRYFVRTVIRIHRRIRRALAALAI
ncbi:MAG TPA: hypothetical protein VGR71_12980 [Nitrospira sp.]|nr:hypothetical protein [Nitrospira sp.]